MAQKNWKSMVIFYILLILHHDIRNDSSLNLTDDSIPIRFG
jgi:hypothetical protein